MHTKKTCRFNTAKDGSLEIVIPLPAKFLRAAEQTAQIIGKDRGSLIVEWFNAWLPTMPDAVEEHGIVSMEWEQFKTRADACAFVDRLNKARPGWYAQAHKVTRKGGAWRVTPPELCVQWPEGKAA